MRHCIHLYTVKKRTPSRLSHFQSAIFFKPFPCFSLAVPVPNALLVVVLTHQEVGVPVNAPREKRTAG